MKLAVSKPTAAAGELKSVDVRQILVKRELKLSFTYHNRTNDIVKNYTADESAQLLADMLQTQFTSAKLFTTQEDIVLIKTSSGFEVRHIPPSQTQKAALSHDRAKKRLIQGANNSYLHALGVTDVRGNVHQNMQDKFRQINKYVEILDGLLKRLPSSDDLQVVDMGSGKGYLTFALYDHLVNHLGKQATIVGVEYRAELVKQCNDVAKAAGFSGLTFVQGSIAEYDCARTDIMIALHACDTATDDAIHKAVMAKASLIVVAPCCHKQIRREMTGKQPPQALDFLMKFGTYMERLAEMVTDGMRAQLMELCGYRTNLFEFISDAHTPKNVMIVATKLPSPLSEKEAGILRASLDKTKQRFGIAYHHLERLFSTGQ